VARDGFTRERIEGSEQRERVPVSISDPQAPHASPAEPRCLRVLKRDVFGRVEQWSVPEGFVARRVAQAHGPPGAGFVARLLLARERRALEHWERSTGGAPGVPRLYRGSAARELSTLPGAGERRLRASECLTREWIEGEPLPCAQALPRDWFERLAELVRALHACGLCHNDLHKEQNLIVAQGGWPWLVDFQLASVHARRGALHASRARDDLRHVAKHARRYELQGRPKASLGERARLPRRSWLAAAWRRFGKPLYVRLANGAPWRASGEVRRASSGPWPSWEAPLGARDSSRTSEARPSSPANARESSREVATHVRREPD